MKRLRQVPRVGFTLIELLVVIAIISILVALLLPAIQKVREAANQAQCAANLRQLAMAVHSYHTANKIFPQNWGGNQGSNLGIPNPSAWGSTSASWSWIAMLLPYLEQKNIYNQAQLINTANGTPQTPLTIQFNGAYVISQPVPILRCPSDPDFGQVLFPDRADMNGLNSFVKIPVAISNYKGVCGANWMWGSPLWNPGWLGANFVGSALFAPQDGRDNGNGVLWRSNGTNNKTYNMNSVDDGTSNTFLIGEDIPSHSYYCGSWAYANNVSGTCAIYPNAMAGNLQLFPLGDWFDNYSFFSGHVNGVNFAMCDGSVHFIQNTIGVNIYRYLATARGGESASLPN